VVDYLCALPKIQNNDYYLRHLYPSVSLYEQLGSKKKIDFHEIWYLSFFFENLSRKFKFNQNHTIITVTLHEGRCTFLIISHSILHNDCVFGILHRHNPSGRTMALGLTQPLTEIISRNISCWVKAVGAKGWQLLPPSCADCFEIWEPQPAGTLWACPGLQ